ncbi:ImmA/IrrE family metallo-endopeptidase [Kineosporia sp. J2-2]|uniref:ImmA/IrrE family metallo-endopeptidase n=1 Tax=Kineosporia corallincola TaxID=2835133 RepID=A0ABS5TU01_9ACTN|nr:XRE family transcriptional regulator [Kineosporia corallincola]MBT0774286.1 ImmA/IrrE family metallo-endopeptidase [Kineosporia corallincola]
MSTTADRVRELIAASGLTHRVFAERIGLDATKLSKSLSGSRRFSSLDLAEVSELCGVTVDWLITGTEPELAVAARSTGGTAAVALEEAQRLSTMRSDMAFLGFGQPWHEPDLSGLRQGSAEERAAAARARITEVGRSVSEPELAEVVEAAFGVDVTVCALGQDFDGLSVSSDEAKLILVGTSQMPARQRFTIAHELGHLLNGDDQQIHIDANVYNAKYRLDESERLANAFAAALLMPSARLREAVGGTGIDEPDFARLADELAVSPSSLALRLKDLRLIDAGVCDRFRKLSSARAAAMAGRGDVYADLVARSSRPRPPGLLCRDAYRAYESGEATLRPYAALLGVEVDSLRESLESH